MIRKVWKKNNSEQLLVTIEKDKGIEEGDCVRIIKVPDSLASFSEEE